MYPESAFAFVSIKSITEILDFAGWTRNWSTEDIDLSDMQMIV